MKKKKKTFARRSNWNKSNKGKSYIELDVHANEEAEEYFYPKLKVKSTIINALLNPSSEKIK